MISSSPFKRAYFDDRQNRLRVVVGNFVGSLEQECPGFSDASAHPYPLDSRSISLMTLAVISAATRSASPLRVSSSE